MLMLICPTHTRIHTSNIDTDAHIIVLSCIKTRTKLHFKISSCLLAHTPHHRLPSLSAPNDAIRFWCAAAATATVTRQCALPLIDYLPAKWFTPFNANTSHHITPFVVRVIVMPMQSSHNLFSLIYWLMAKSLVLRLVHIWKQHFVNYLPTFFFCLHSRLESVCGKAWKIDPSVKCILYIYVGSFCLRPAGYRWRDIRHFSTWNEIFVILSLLFRLLTFCCA